MSPALFRNGDASSRPPEDKPRRLASVGDLSSEEGWFVPIPPGSRRNPHVSYFGVESPGDRKICSDLLDRLALAHMAYWRLATMSGRIVAEGEPDVILQPDLLSTHYDAGIGVVTTPEGERVVITHRTRPLNLN